MEVEPEFASSQPKSCRSHPLPWLDLFVWTVVAMLAMAAAYHPYFFGDEISPLRDAASSEGMWDALRKISTYKPRLVFNAIWAFGGISEWPRWYFAAINAAGVAVIGASCAAIAIRWFGATRKQMWLLLAAILLSRFSAMIYFDYVSGIIETASLAFLLLAILATISVYARSSIGGILVVVVLATCAVLVHERYMAATFAVGCVVAAATVLRPRGERHRLHWLLAVSVAVIPAITFLVLVKSFDSLPVSTGTSGQAVALDMGTLKVFSMYLGNLFFGLNFGKDWFVGSLNMGSTAGRVVAILSAVVFSTAWFRYGASLRRDRARLLQVGALMLVILSLVVMASLPGEGRQEARWMYPVGVLVCLLYFCTPRVAVRYSLLGLTLALASVHWLSGALNSTANVYVSRTAQYLGEGVNGTIPQGRRAVLVGLGDDPWEVGQRSGVAEFARRNFRSHLQLKIFDPSDTTLIEWADLGIVRAVNDERSASRFALVQGSLLRFLLRPELIDKDRLPVAGIEVLGDPELGWGGWTWSVDPQQLDGQVVLESARRLVGFNDRPASALDGRILVYRAGLADGADGAAKMRLQVNWMGADGRFLGASIEVVDVHKGIAEYSMMLNAPEAAERGLVYANLHDGEEAPVLLQSVHVQTRKVQGMGRGEEWTGWRWQGPVVLGAGGLLLGGDGVAEGFREMQAADLDNRLLVYRARTTTVDDSSSMRLQVNWVDKDQKFLGATIQVVTVQGESRNYPMFVVAPPNATAGLVYANLHGPNEAGVVLESVDVISGD